MSDVLLVVANVQLLDLCRPWANTTRSTTTLAPTDGNLRNSKEPQNISISIWTAQSATRLPPLLTLPASTLCCNMCTLHHGINGGFMGPSFWCITFCISTRLSSILLMCLASSVPIRKTKRVISVRSMSKSNWSSYWLFGDRTLESSLLILAWSIMCGSEFRISDPKRI